MTTTRKLVLDATCGARGIWFDKHDQRAVFVDRRQEHHESHFGVTSAGTRTLDIAPDILADFTNLPFADESFWHVVWDPPHMVDLKASAWYAKAYGSLDSSNWREVIRAGFCECWRVLKPCGTLVFKWAEVNIPSPEILALLPVKPMYGQHCGKKAGTHWMIFFKEPDLFSSCHA